MKKNNTSMKLQLRKETLQRLLDEQLDRVQGGEEKRSDVSNNCCDPGQTSG